MIELITNKESGVGIQYPGFKGDTGGYYIPDVDADGTLTWQASEEGMPEAEAANIKGDKGDKGDSGVYVGENEPTDDSLVWINPNGGETEALATKDYVDTQIAAIVIPDVSGFATKAEIQAAGYLTEVPAEYITETELNSKGFAKTTDIPDVSGFATKSEVQSAGYQTAADVEALINSTLVEVENGSY